MTRVPSVTRPQQLGSSNKGLSWQYSLPQRIPAPRTRTNFSLWFRAALAQHAAPAAPQLTRYPRTQRTHKEHDRALNAPGTGTAAQHAVALGLPRPAAQPFAARAGAQH